ncbi:MAG TPA: hypothetical protein VN802_08615 [Stellaceae bacterium]|nr:hypothetical protein [Stellaceae bacterium]
MTRRWLWAEGISAAILIAGALCVLGAHSSPTFQVCVERHEKDQRYYPRQDKETPGHIFVKTGIVYFGCGVRTADIHQGALSIFFAAILATVGFLQFLVYRGQLAATKAMQRAFIAVEADGVEDFFGVRPVAKVKIINTGNLPATGMDWTVFYDIGMDHRRKVFRIDETDMERGTNLLAPKAEMRRFQYRALNYDEIDLFYCCDGAVYVYGIVYYFDGFGTKRWTKFCHRYDKHCFRYDAHMRPKRNLSGRSARQHQFGNGTDEDEDEGDP